MMQVRQEPALLLSLSIRVTFCHRRRVTLCHRPPRFLLLISFVLMERDAQHGTGRTTAGTFKSDEISPCCCTVRQATGKQYEFARIGIAFGGSATRIRRNSKSLRSLDAHRAFRWNFWGAASAWEDYGHRLRAP